MTTLAAVPGLPPRTVQVEDIGHPPTSDGLAAAFVELSERGFVVVGPAFTLAEVAQIARRLEHHEARSGGRRPRWWPR